MRATHLMGAIALAALTAPTAALAAGSAGGTVDPAIYRLMVFVIAIFVGYYVVWSVTPALHTATDSPASASATPGDGQVSGIDEPPFKAVATISRIMSFNAAHT